MKPHVLVILAVLGGAALSLGTACSSSSPSSGGSSSGSTSSSGSGSGSSSGGGDAASGDTWASWGQGFFSTYCVECHSSTDSTGRDFTQQSIVVANKDTIRCGVCVQQDPSWNCPASPPAKQFPISDSAGTNPKPTDTERNRVVAWIGAGCP
jgi:hypothetical protein